MILGTGLSLHSRQRIHSCTEKVSQKYECSGGNVWRCSKSNFPGDFKGSRAFFWDGGKMLQVNYVLSLNWHRT